MVQAVGRKVATGIAKNYRLAENARSAAFSGGAGWTASGLFNTGLAIGGHPVIGCAGLGCSIYEAISNFKQAIKFKKIVKNLEPEYQKIVERARQIYKK